MKSKNKTFQQYLKIGRIITDFEIVDNKGAELSEMIQNWKRKYFHDFSLKLNNLEPSLGKY